MIIQTSLHHTLPCEAEALAQAQTVKQELIKNESLSAMLIALCTSDWAGFLLSKKRLAQFQTQEVCAEASRLLAKNSRSFRLLSVVSHPAFFSDWEAEKPADQSALFGALAVYSINRSMKEAAFHRVLTSIRKGELSKPNSSKPTKLRLRDCHLLIAKFMHEYATQSDVNLGIVMKTLVETQQTGCGHLPLQQSLALMKRLRRV